MVKKVLGGLLAVFITTSIVFASTAVAGITPMPSTNDLIGINNDGTSKATTFWTPYIGVASDFNVFLEGNFTATGSDCGGRLAVGGDFSTPYPYSIGNDYAQPASVALAVIGGNVTGGGINASNGKQTYLVNNSKLNASFNLSGSNDATLVRDNISNFLNFSTVFSQLRLSSSNLAIIKPDGAVISQYGAIICTGNNPKLNIFTVSTDFWNANATNGCELKFNVPTDSSVILNIVGAQPANIKIYGIYYNSSNPCQAISSASSKIMLNFPDSPLVNIMSSFTGSIFAPNADITAGSGHLEGQLIAKSFYGPYEFGMKFRNTTPPPTPPTTTTAVTTTPTTTQTTTTPTTTAVTTTPTATQTTTTPTTTAVTTTPTTTQTTTTPTTTAVTTTPTTTQTTTTPTTTAVTTTPSTTTTVTTVPTSTPTTTLTGTTSVTTAPTTTLTSITSAAQTSTINLVSTSIPLNTLGTTSNDIITSTKQRYLDIQVNAIPLGNNPQTSYYIGILIVIVFVASSLLCVLMAIIKKSKSNK